MFEDKSQYSWHLKLVFALVKFISGPFWTFLLGPHNSKFWLFKSVFWPFCEKNSWKLRDRSVLFSHFYRGGYSRGAPIFSSSKFCVKFKLIYIIFSKSSNCSISGRHFGLIGRNSTLYISLSLVVICLIRWYTRL